MEIKRVWAMSNKWTFKVKPLLNIVLKYCGDGKNWVDMFSGFNSPVEITNDINPETPAKYHMDAHDFIQLFDNSSIDGVIFDPPYSISQVKRSYDKNGLESLMSKNSKYFDPTASFTLVKENISRILKPGGICISFGWNTNGIGKKRGMEIIEILIVAHGGGRNDTLVTVERKVRRTLEVE